ncbi:E3 SUMO-protein ligase ZBED1-like [Bactrocera tryoni]|uniref:E3 SUMO-protein ligase ZBED1-like n=1 Tax=Bactrocera tryoni TaxID=59916 RepID=UPI001A9568F1|nr:E3 SUMO-protein ligase ZBED1-like [Bactrocera tryoni]XP_039969733.1 E3 SUMO-protein ligase ZBED1-like [Bactrocera tryoni]XP_039969734.1 E3 SUMO-protein ligase ZBED1-like [Bactrocera tryoni]
MKEMDPRYRLPSRSHLRDEVIPSQYESLKNKLHSVLNDIDFVAITTDLWTSKANEGYITVTCHLVLNSFTLESAILATRQLLDTTNHNAINISETLKGVLDDWGVTNKVVCVVTDNDAVMLIACELFEYKHLPCVAHTINLIVQDVRLPDFDVILTKCMSVVGFFKRSQIAYSKFKGAQGDNPHSLLQEMPTRWNSAFEMIKRILKTNEFITLALVSSRGAPLPFSAEEVDILNDISELLSPFEETTLSVSTNTKVSASIIIPVICELNHKVNNIKVNTEKGKNIFTTIKFSLTKRLASYETRTIPRIATILDPRFKKHGFCNPFNAEEGVKAVQPELFTKLPANPLHPPTSPTQEPSRFSFLQVKSQNKVHSSWADAIILMRQHFGKENQPENCDPLSYWQITTDGDAFKTLAKKYFCVPASSCESERVFSKAGQLISKRRTRQSSTVVDKLLFLNKNKHVINM